MRGEPEGCGAVCTIRTYGRINNKKSTASGAGNFSEPGCHTLGAGVREVVCA